jgi:glycosyltransferase involved in cell wall biosynthesis
MLNQSYGLRSKLHVVTNGYDCEELAQVKARSHGHAAIVYAGTFYPPKRVISPIMKALSNIKTDMDSRGWYFHYFGPHGDHFRTEAERFDVINRVVLHGNVPRPEVLAALRGAAVGIVITSIFSNSSQEDKGIVPGKLFEIIGLGTPVLLVTPSAGDIHDIVNTTGLVGSFAGNDIEGIGEFIRNAIRGHAPQAKCPEAYSWANIVKKLDSVLRNASGQQARPRVFAADSVPYTTA